MSFEQIGSNKSFDGQQLRYRHRSDVLNCDMTFSIYLPPAAESTRVPVLYWLSGLTCTDENFVTKAGVQRYASELGVAIVAPDTSPRGEGVPDDPNGDWDFGLGAGFYVNATQEPWDQHYRMYDYIVDELPALINDNFSVDGDRAGIFGHSMGGHGALVIALRNPDRYRSVSAFAPISSPMRCSWGEKALSRYLGDDQEVWREYDATELLLQAKDHVPMLIDQGEADDFLKPQLKPQFLEQAAASAGYPLQLRMQAGYDHSYFFIASFIEQHIRFHTMYL